VLGIECRERLEPLWRAVLLHHFHDILPGSSIERVNREARETYAWIAGELDGFIAELLERMPRVGDARSADTPAAVNLSPVPRDEHVLRDGTWYRARLAPYSAGVLEAAEQHPELSFDADTLSNGVLTLRFGASGEIVSCRDSDGVEHAADGLNRLALHHDRKQFPYDAWDIGDGYLKRTPRILKPSGVESRVDGPTVVRRQVYRFGRSRIEQLVRLEAGSELVRFDTRVEWHENHRMLRAEFRPAHFGETVACEIQFGHLHRPTTERDAVERAQFEVCAHKWVATEDAGGGFALLNDSKYGHRAKSGLLSLNLLRAPTFPDKVADRGLHSFSYAFRPFRAGALDDVIRDGYRLNHPLLTASGLELASVADTTPTSGVIVETLKPAENGSGVIVRLYESRGRPTTTALRTTLPHSAAIETDLLERPIASANPVDLDRIGFTPFEIKTLLLETR
jgi:alpha-mannosidase